MEEFKMNLQLFAEDDTPPENTEGQGDEQEVVSESQDVNTDENTDDTDLDSPKIALDENGRVVFLDDEDEDESKGDEEEVPPDEKPKTRKLKVGEQEVEVTEEELEKGYLRQSDYTKKMQELAKQRQEIERLAKQAMTPPKEVAPPQPVEDFATFNKRITEEAIKLAKQRLNLAPDAELSEIDFEHQNAFHLARKEIESYLDQTTRHHRDMTTMERELRVEEPEFDAVFDFMMDKLDNELPARVSKEVQKAYQTGDTAKLKEFFNHMRVDYYAKKNGTDVKATPKAAKQAPKLEGAGKGDIGDTPKQKRDATVLRDPKLTFEDKVKKLKEWGIADF